MQGARPLQPIQGLGHAGHAQLQPIHAGGVRDADVVHAAERVARDHRDVGLLHQVVGQPVGVAHRAAVILFGVGGGHVGEEVEGAVGCGAAHPVHGLQPAQQGVAPPEHLAGHAGQVALGALHGSHAGVLGDGGGVGGGVALDLGHGPDNFPGARRVADAPAGHAVRLAHAVDHDGPLLQLRGQGGHGDMGVTVVAQLLVDLVGDDPDPRLLAHLAQLGQLVTGIGRPRRVGRVVEDDGLGIESDGRAQARRGQAEAVLLPGIHHHRDAARQADLFRV